MLLNSVEFARIDCGNNLHKKKETNMAKLYFRYGSMGSSKTANALMVKYNYEERGQNVILVKPEIDTRDDEGIIKSRMGLKAPVVTISKDKNIIELIDIYKKVDCIIVDEAQFLNKQQVHQLCTLVDDYNIPVICYGLRTDFIGNLFEGSQWLLALADSIEEVKTVCFCGKKAIMNMRLNDGEPVFEGEQVQIGGNESYIAVCRNHWRLGQYK